MDPLTAYYNYYCLTDWLTNWLTDWLSDSFSDKKMADLLTDSMINWIVY